MMPSRLRVRKESRPRTRVLTREGFDDAGASKANKMRYDRGWEGNNKDEMIV